MIKVVQYVYADGGYLTLTKTIFETTLEALEFIARECKRHGEWMHEIRIEFDISL